MLVEFPNSLDEIPIERHGRLGDLEWGKQANGCTVIRQSPPQWGRHPVGMDRAQRVAFAWTDGSREIVKPHGPVVVREGQYGSTGTATTDADLNHGMNLDGATDENKDLPRLLKAGPS